MQLVVQNGPGAGKQFNLAEKPLILGKDPGSEIPVPDTTMAGKHVRFENVGGVVYITDLESGNGTFLNGQRMSPGARYPLRPDDAIQVGATKFKIQAALAPVAANNAAGNAQAPANGFAANSPDSEVVAAGNQLQATPGPLQPYQYQISTAHSPAKPAAQAPAKQGVKKNRRKVNWPSVIAALFVVVLLNLSVIYFINSNTSSTIEIRNTGQATRAPVKFTPLLPTNTPDLSGASFKGPTPGIGANTQATPVQLRETDVPVYPGARRIDNPTSAVYFTQFITSDNFDKLVDWARMAFSDKGWSNVEVKNLPGKEGAVLTGQKGNLSAVAYLLGPGQKDTAPYNNFFRSASVDPNRSIVVINITVS